jgi:nucleoside-triphosphatase
VPGVFLQGPKGSGKTTLLFKALNSCAWNAGRPRLGGFVVKRVYSRGRWVALDIVDLLTRGRRRLVTIDNDGTRTRYPEVFTEIGVPAIERAVRFADIVAMDELGRIELGVPAFTTAVLDTLAGPVPVAGVLKDESNPFLDAIRAMPGVRVIKVSAGSRETAARDLGEAFEDLFTRCPQIPR